MKRVKRYLCLLILCCSLISNLISVAEPAWYVTGCRVTMLLTTFHAIAYIIGMLLITLMLYTFYAEFVPKVLANAYLLLTLASLVVVFVDSCNTILPFRVFLLLDRLFGLAYVFLYLLMIYMLIKGDAY